MTRAGLAARTAEWTPERARAAARLLLAQRRESADADRRAKAQTRKAVRR